MSDSPNQTTLQPALPLPDTTRGTASSWWPAILLVGFLLAAFLIKDNAGADLHHPYLKADTDSGVSVTFLQYGLTDRKRCAKQLADMAQAMQNACPICRVTEQSCKAALSDEEYDWLSDTPLPQASARSPQGVILYDAQTPDAALATCQASEQHAINATAKSAVRCFTPNVERPYPTEQQARITTARHNFEGILALIICLGATITALIIVAKRRASQGVRISHGWAVKLTLAGLDTFVMLAAYAILGFPDFDEPMALQHFDRKNLLTHAALVVSTLAWFWVILEHYTRRRPFWDELREIFRTLGIQLLLAGAAVFYLGLDSGRGMTLLTWASLFVLMPLGRASARVVLDAVGLWQRPALIVGTGENAKDAWLAIQSERCMGYNIIGFMATPNTHKATTHIQIANRALPVISSDDPRATIEALDQPELIIALDTTATPEKQRLIRQLTSSCRNIHFIPSIRGLPLFGTQLSHFFSHDVLFLSVRNNLARRSYRWLKRGFDVVAASLLLVLLSPLFATLTVLIWRSGASPFYGHTRVGRRGRAFKCLKFRSMRPDADKILHQLLDNDPNARAEWERDFKLKNDPRITAVGHFLRKTSLDELPQLINVIKGDMSLVGPRPIVSAELERYGDQVNLYLQARPGVTGLWQVSGRNDTGYAERVSLDAWYVQNWSLWYDIAILFKTVDVVVGRRGAY